MTAQPAVRIITDSSCDLSAAEIAEFGIIVVPLEIRFGRESFVDGEELSTAEFWAKSRASDELPSTAAPSPGNFATAYEQAVSEGASEAVVITLSGELSATIEAAQQAAQTPPSGLSCHVVDSRSVSAGLGLLVIEAARLAGGGTGGGTGGADIARSVQEMSGRIRVQAALDTLENLRKGGRIGAAASLLGSVLSIKPLITVAAGKVEAAGKQRTRARALAHLVDYVTEAGPRIAQIAVMHADCDDVDAFAERVAQASGSQAAPRVMMIGPVVGSHAGVGTIGVVFIERAQ